MKHNKTIIFEIYYLGQCGCGFKRNVTRKIEIKETQTLEDLHNAIIYDAFGWDDPHMYSFHFDNIPYSENRKMEYSCDPESNMIDGIKPKSTKTKLKNLNLKKNQKILFVFDFGDDHQFGIMVKEFGEIALNKKYPIIVEEKGKSPKQYAED